jgi:bacillithiol biosynthesis deacetylase BshB1
MASDALFFGAHPDDVELASGGLAALLSAHGHAVAIADLTRGEAASRGTAEARASEAQAAARELGVRERENLGLPDLGLDRSSVEQLAAVVECLRRHRPVLVVAPGRDDPHPDHVEGSHLVERACYVSGLARFPAAGARHRPGRLLFSLYRSSMRPQVVVDVTAVWERRLSAVRAHRSQLDPSAGPSTYLTHPDFQHELEARARVWGASIGARYGEGYRLHRPLGIADARVLIDAVPHGVVS